VILFDIRDCEISHRIVEGRKKREKKKKKKEKRREKGVTLMTLPHINTVKSIPEPLQILAQI